MRAAAMGAGVRSFPQPSFFRHRQEHREKEPRNPCPAVGRPGRPARQSDWRTGRQDGYLHAPPTCRAASPNATAAAAPAAATASPSARPAGSLSIVVAATGLLARQEGNGR